MSKSTIITRREFIQTATVMGAGVLGARFLLPDVGAQEPPFTLPPHAREARYYTSLREDALNCTTCHGETEPSRVLYCHVSHAGDYVKCELCPHGCIISEGQRGTCRVRENRGGKLYTMVYGNPVSMNNDPIEKKPLYHFLPGTLALSLATAGCNLRCKYCQNWEISQFPPEELATGTKNLLDYLESRGALECDPAPCEIITPEQLAELAYSLSSPTIAYTYSEPMIFYEYMLDAARAARPRGIHNVVISAGYINPAPLRELCAAVDAIKIDFKGFSEEFYRDVCGGTLAPVLETLRTIHESGTHLEIVTLVVPTLNDSEDELRGMAKWVVDNLGVNVPCHYSRFHPMYKLKNLPPTPVETLELAWQAARDAGIRYAYIGNVPGHRANNTYCHHCGELLIERRGYQIVQFRVEDGKCSFCDAAIPGVWE